MVMVCLVFVLWVFVMGGLFFVILLWYKFVYGLMLLVFVILIIFVMECFFVSMFLVFGGGVGGVMMLGVLVKVMSLKSVNEGNGK